LQRSAAADAIATVASGEPTRCHGVDDRCQSAIEKAAIALC
jgi:hypothetical protein